MPSLPTVGGSENTWGQELSDWLLVGHNADGTLQAAGTSRNDALVQALGLISEPFQISSGATGLAPTSQRAFAAGVALVAGETITNIVVNLTTAGSGAAPTLIKMGLYSKAGVSLALTANVNSNTMWTTGGTGYKQVALTTPYAVPTTDLYYAVFLKNGAFATTDIQLARGANLTAASEQIGTFARRWGDFGAAETDLKAVGLSATMNSAGNCLWLAVN